MKLALAVVFIFFSFFCFSEDKPQDEPQNSGSLDIPLLNEEEEQSEDEQTESEPQKEELENIEPEDLTAFFLEQVVPAFGGFKEIFHQKPSFDIKFDQNGAVIKSCSAALQLSQKRSIEYNIADLNLYDFQSNIEIGGPRYILLNLKCEEGKFFLDAYRFRILLTVADEAFDPSFYSIRVKALEQEQVHLKLWSVELLLSLENSKKQMGFNPQGDLVLAADLKSQNIPFDELTIEQTISFTGIAHLSLPVSAGGAREESKIRLPVQGTVFISESGEVIPVVDISME